MQGFVVRRLLRIVADQGHIVLGGFDRAAAFRGDLNLSICGRDRTHGRFSIFQGDMQFRVGLDVLNGVHFQRNVIGGISVEHQRLAVGFHDGPGQTIAIFERDLIGKEQEEKQRDKQGWEVRSGATRLPPLAREVSDDFGAQSCYERRNRDEANGRRRPREPQTRSGLALGFGLLGLVGGSLRRRIVLHAIFQRADSFAQTFAELRQLFGTEHQQRTAKITSRCIG